MIPHLGVLSTVHRKASLEIFEKDCLIRLGTCVGFSGKLTPDDYGKEVASLNITMPDGEVLDKQIEYGTIQKIELEEGKTAEIEGRVSSPFSLTTKEGTDRNFKIKVEGGIVGILIDARGRPVDLPEDDEARRNKLREWFTKLEAYPETILEDD